MLIKMIVPVVLGATLSVCPFGGERPGGYARITGIVRAEDGSSYRGSVSVFCGGNGITRGTDLRGRYAVEYRADPLPESPMDADGNFRLGCRVTAPADRSPSAVRYDSVTFTRERGARRTAVIDLVEGQVEQPPPVPDPQP